MADPQTRRAAAKPLPRQKDTPAPPPVVQRFRQILPSDLKIDFVGRRFFFIVLSTVLNLLAVVLFFTRGFNFGIDFVGGTDIRVRFAEATTASTVRSDLSDLNLRDLTVQDFGVQGKEFLLRFEIDEGSQMSSISDVIKGALKKSFPGENAFELLSVQSVGPKVGADLRRRGFLAVGCATLFMGIYIAFRFEASFGVGAVIALIHDVLIASGALMLTQMAFDLTTLAAMLTVVGFSVHDTIIVSDRIRENLRKNRKAELATVINQSINETLSRTILTSGTALLVLFALFFLGGKGLEPFAFTLIIGFITGTYSSIYIAAPVVLFWSKRSKLAQS
jgi:preprotein translocase subunit SecF